MISRIEAESTITPLELLVLRPVFREHSSVTLTDMLSIDLDMALKVEEYLDILDSFQEIEVKKMEAENTARKLGR